MLTIKRRLRQRLLTSILVLLIVPSLCAQNAKKKVDSEADLPRFSYPVAGSASSLVQADGATFNTFLSKLRADLDGILRDYQIDDKSTMRTLLAAKLDIQELSGEYKDALATADALQGLQEKPSAKLTSGIFEHARLQAASETHATSGAAYEQAFTKHFRGAVDALPWDVVQDWAKQAYVNARTFTKPLAIGRIMTELDPAVKESEALNNEEAWYLVATRDELQFGIPLANASR